MAGYPVVFVEAGGLPVTYGSDGNGWPIEEALSGLPVTIVAAGGLPVVEGVGVSYEAEATALFARFTTQPDATRKGHINTLIKALLLAGVWAKLDALYVMAAHDAQAARQNWKQDLYSLTTVSSPTFTTDRGYQGDGAASYLKSGFVPTTAGGLFTLNSAHVSIWSRTSAQANTVEMGARVASGNDQTFIQTRASPDRAVWRVNQDVAASDVVSTDGSGMFAITRRASADSELFRNGASPVGPGTSVSDGMPNVEIYIGSLNTAGVAGLFSARQFAAGSIGAGLSAADALAFYNALNTYLQAVGAA